MEIPRFKKRGLNLEMVQGRMFTDRLAWVVLWLFWLGNALLGLVSERDGSGIDFDLVFRREHPVHTLAMRVTPRHREWSSRKLDFCDGCVCDLLGHIGVGCLAMLGGWL